MLLRKPDDRSTSTEKFLIDAFTVHIYIKFKYPNFYTLPTLEAYHVNFFLQKQSISYIIVLILYNRNNIGPQTARTQELTQTRHFQCLNLFPSHGAFRALFYMKHWSSLFFKKRGRTYYCFSRNCNCQRIYVMMQM